MLDVRTIDAHERNESRRQHWKISNVPWIQNEAQANSRQR